MKAAMEKVNDYYSFRRGERKSEHLFHPPREMGERSTVRAYRLSWRFPIR
jgi:hypothetical protein